MIDVQAFSQESAAKRLGVESRMLGASLGSSVGAFVGNRMFSDDGTATGALGDLGGAVVGGVAGWAGGAQGSKAYAKTSAFTEAVSRTSVKDFNSKYKIFDNYVNKIGGLGGMALGGAAGFMYASATDSDSKMIDTSAGMSLGSAVGILGGLGATKYKIGKMTKAS